MSRRDHGRDALLRRVVPQPAPRAPDAADAWRQLGADDHQRLRRAATDVVAARAIDDERRRALVLDLARQRAVRRPPDLVVPLLTGLLVFSTIWGFGRAAFPEAAGSWLVAGLIALLLVVLHGVHRGSRRRQRATAVVRALTAG